MLRTAFAHALRLLRRHHSVHQADFEGGVSQSHISRLEKGETSVTLEKLEEIAAQLGVHPLSLAALAWGGSQQIAPAELLERVRAELESVDGMTQPISLDDQPAVHPRIVQAEKVRDEVQRLKALGHSKAEVSRLMGIAKSTTARHW
ncbi:helix-turn-helix transcriptional regulator [Pseudomonas putida]|uniref:helix-turn-helix domain-containing protein n=1 Tax=Pseudomonas putida TaxID=303 RepID=UPI0023634CE5|nr:helix-turn-helix transcriptional regulator [Pseudomonas putida]MDD1963878.1 helix-turn-helix transcriptional regulator [Pseudomonas putida]